MFNYPHKKFAKIKKSSGEVSEFASIPPDELVEDDDRFKENEHFYWIEYSEEREDYVEDSVSKTNWYVIINGERVGKLDDFNLDCVYKKNINKILPKVSYGDMNPDHFVFDFEIGEWKAPLFELDGIKIWDSASRKYVSI